MGQRTYGGVPKSCPPMTSMPPTAAGAAAYPLHVEEGAGQPGAVRACWHLHREPVNLLVWPHEHVADLCADCGAQFDVPR